jgi:hypothetical protein
MKNITNKLHLLQLKVLTRTNFNKGFLLPFSPTTSDPIILERGFERSVLANNKSDITKEQYKEECASVNNQKFWYVSALSSHYAFATGLPFFKKSLNILPSLTKVLFSINRLNETNKSGEVLSLLVLSPKKSGFLCLYLGLTGTVSSAVLNEIFLDLFNNFKSLKSFFNLIMYFSGAQTKAHVINRVPLFNLKLSVAAFVRKDTEKRKGFKELQDEQEFLLENELTPSGALFQANQVLEAGEPFSTTLLTAEVQFQEESNEFKKPRGGFNTGVESLELFFVL